MLNNTKTPSDTGIELIDFKAIKQKKRKRKKKRFFTIVKRVLFLLVVIVGLLVYGAYGICQAIFLGPSPTARDKLVISALETSAMKFLPGLFLTQEAINAIIASNQVVTSGEATDTSLVHIPTGNGQESEQVNDQWGDFPEGIRVEDVTGDTFRGKMMLIRDPSRVYVGTSSNFKEGKPGLTIKKAVEEEGAVGAVNGGGFPDDGGMGSGNVPLGLVFSKGEMLWGSLGTTYKGVMGFDKNHVLIVGDMTGQQAKDIGIRDCVSFGPALIVNGEPAETSGSSSGVNPRTAIGQQEDGTVLLLCIDGRQPASLGATYADIIDVMLEYGAINAGNLDGGTSTTMLYNGEIVNVPSSLYGPRKIPTFVMVRGEER